MSTASQFENRRRERLRRERLRKKRIRAAILLIVLICIIVLIVIAVSNGNSDSEKDMSETQSVQTTAAPEELTVPTVEPVKASSSIPPASEENNLLEILSKSGQTKCCYLTFDDGPTENITPQILDTLRRYNVKATFFEVGSLINSNPDMARRVYKEGHLIANHSQGHNYEKLYASTDAFITEVLNCEESIKSVMDGEEPFKLIRFPGGGYNSGDHASIKQECKKVLKENGFYYADWNALNGDAEGKKKNAQELLEYLKQTAKGYNNLVVLMHDASTKQATADALGPIIEYLMSEGYTFHRLDDINYQPASSQSAQSGNSSSSTAAPSASSTPSSQTAAPTANAATPAAATAAPTAAAAQNTPIPQNQSGAIIIQ